MPIYEPVLAQTIAQLIARQGELAAAREERAASERARAEQLAGQIWSQALGSASQTLAQAMSPQAQLARLTYQQAREKVTDEQKIREAIQAEAEPVTPPAPQAPPAPVAVRPLGVTPPPAAPPSAGAPPAPAAGGPQPMGPPAPPAQAPPAPPTSGVFERAIGTAGFSMGALAKRYGVLDRAVDRLLREGNHSAASRLSDQIRTWKAQDLRSLVDLGQLAHLHSEEQARALAGVATPEAYREVWQRMPDHLKVDLPPPDQVTTRERVEQIYQSRLGTSDYLRYLQLRGDEIRRNVERADKLAPHLVSMLAGVERLPPDERAEAWEETYQAMTLGLPPGTTIPGVPATYSPANLELVRQLRDSYDRGELYPVYGPKGEIVWETPSGAAHRRAAPRPVMTPPPQTTLSSAEVDALVRGLEKASPSQRAAAIGELPTDVRAQVIAGLVRRGITDVGDRGQIDRFYRQQIEDTIRPLMVGGADEETLKRAAASVERLERTRRRALGLPAPTREEMEGMLRDAGLPVPPRPGAQPPTPAPAPRPGFLRRFFGGMWGGGAPPAAAPATPPPATGVRERAGRQIAPQPTPAPSAVVPPQPQAVPPEVVQAMERFPPGMPTRFRGPDGRVWVFVKEADGTVRFVRHEERPR